MSHYKYPPKSNLHFLLKATLLALFLLSFTGCASIFSSKDASEQIAPEAIAPADLIREHMDSCRIVIPGISRDYHLLFLTDTHVTIPSDSDSEEEHAYCMERLKHFTTNSGCMASKLFTAWIEIANQETWDGLLLGGDIIDCPTTANVEYLHTAFNNLKIPYLYTPGNHDWTFPWEYMTEKGTSQYLASLSPYMKNNTIIHTLEYDDFIVVAVDNSSNQIHPNALQEYKNILAQGKPIIVMLHVPLYTEELLAKTSQVWNSGVVLGGGVHGGIYPDKVSTKFLSLTTADNSPVVAVLAGHVHLADRSNLSDEPAILQITGDAGYKGKSLLLHITAGERNKS